MAVKTRMDDEGFLEGIDEETGEVVWREKRKTVLKDGKLERASSPGQGRPRREDKNTHHYVMSADGLKLYVPKGTNPDNLPRTIWPFSQVTADLVCQMITEGKTIKAIGEMEGMPPAHIVHKWSRKYPEFKREIREAQEARATYYADQVMEIAEQTSKDTIMEDRLKTEIKKWRAEVDDPNTYGKRTKIVGDPDQPLTFIVDTGVRRGEPEAVAEDRSKLEDQGTKDVEHE